MAIEFKETHYAGHFPEFWRGEAKILPGGFKPLQNFPIGTVIRKAVPLYVDFDNLSAAVCKTAKVLAGGTTTKVRVPKGHYFLAGDVVTKYGDGSATPSIKEIDTSNGDYDILTLSAAYTGITENDIIVESKAPAQTTDKAEPLYTPNMVNGSNKEFDGEGLPTLDAAFEAVVLIPSLAAPMLPEWMQGVGLKNNANIIYIKQ